jgi:hypothetical protein
MNPSRVGARLRTKQPVRTGFGAGPRSVLVAAGAVAGALYSFVVLLGGLVTPGYDHVAQPVSSLYQAGAANGLAIASAFALYNVFVIAFGVGLAMLAQAVAGKLRRVGIACGVTIVLVGIAGAVDDVFPQDPIGSAITTTGTLHVAFAAVASLLTVVAVALASAWLWRRSGLRALAWYSVGTLLLIVAFGPTTAAATAGSSPFMGLLERITIFSFIAWMVAASVVLARMTRRQGIGIASRSVAASA